MFLAAEEFHLSLPENAISVFTEINNALWAELEQGSLNLEGLYRTRWKRIFERLGVAADGAAFERAFIAQIAHSAQPVDGAEALVKYLAQKYRVFISTNAPEGQQVERLIKAGLYGGIERVFASEQIGFAKPQKEFFSACLERMDGILPEETVMIGDSLSADIFGAHNMGLMTIWYDRRRRGPDKPDYADHKVSSLLQIKELL